MNLNTLDTRPRGYRTVRRLFYGVLALAGATAVAALAGGALIVAFAFALPVLVISGILVAHRVW